MASKRCSTPRVSEPRGSIIFARASSSRSRAEGVGFRRLGFLTNVNTLKFAPHLDFVFPTAHKNIAVDSNPTIGGVVSAKATRPGPFSNIRRPSNTLVSRHGFVELTIRGSEMDRIHPGATAACDKDQDLVWQPEMRGAMTLKPTQEWKPKNCRDPNNRQNNSKRDKADWPMCREFPNFTVRRHRSSYFE